MTRMRDRYWLKWRKATRWGPAPEGWYVIDSLVGFAVSGPWELEMQAQAEADKRNEPYREARDNWLVENV